MNVISKAIFFSQQTITIKSTYFNQRLTQHEHMCGVFTFIERKFKIIAYSNRKNILKA